MNSLILRLCLAIVQNRRRAIVKKMARQSGVSPDQVLRWHEFKHRQDGNDRLSESYARARSEESNH